MIVPAQFREVGGGVITPPYRGCLGYWGAALIVPAQFRKVGGAVMPAPYRGCPGVGGAAVDCYGSVP